jgi:hypothetical protein
VVPAGSSDGPVTVANFAGGAVTVNNAVRFTKPGHALLEGLTFVDDVSEEVALVETTTDPPFTDITLRNLTILGGDAHALRIRGNVNGVTIEACRIDGGRAHNSLTIVCDDTTGEPSSCTWAPSNITIAHCELTKLRFTGAPTEDILQLEGAGDGVAVVNDYISDNPDPGAEDCVDIKGEGVPGAGLLFARNYVDATTCTKEGMVFHGNRADATRAVIEGNYWKGTATDGPTFQTSSQFTFRNNVLDGARLRIDNLMRAIVTYNTFLGGAVEIGAGPVTCSSDLTLANNIFHGTAFGVDDPTACTASRCLGGTYDGTAPGACEGGPNQGAPCHRYGTFCAPGRCVTDDTCASDAECTGGICSRGSWPRYDLLSSNVVFATSGKALRRCKAGCGNASTACDGDGDCTGCTTGCLAASDAANHPGLVTADPLLSTRQWDIAADSPARDVADPSVVVDQDVEGDVRPTGAGYDIGADELVVRCQPDPDCDDTNECTADVCRSGSCEHAAVPDDTTCAEGAGTCCGGTCVVPVCRMNSDCADGNDCTTDSCVAPATCRATCTSTTSADGTVCAAGACCTGSCCSALCCAGQCAAPLCRSDSDCNDGNACTTDVCAMPGTCSASCSSTWLPCGIRDACCGPACTGATDPDCPSTVCSNGVCEGGVENCFTCRSDCRCKGKNCGKGCCGDGVCSGETIRDCPVDCRR